MRDTATQPGQPIPADVIERLTEEAARLAAASQDTNPAEAVAVATTQADALRLLLGVRIPAHSR